MKKTLLFLLLAGRLLSSSAQSWSLTGNSGTSSTTNFVGTTDTASLVFKVNNVFSGIINYHLGNAALGYQSLSRNTTGIDNTAMGTNALISNLSGASNTAVGFESLLANTSGQANAALGVNALYNNTSGNRNVAAGGGSLYGNYTGYQLTAIGDSSDVMFDGYNNSTAVGFQATITGSNQVRIGNTLVTSIGGYANWSNFSDGRYKKNINTNVPGLSFINALRPITYNLDVSGIESYLHAGQKQGYSATSLEKADNSHKEQFLYSGFVAQEVETAAKKLGYSFSGVDAPKNDKDLYALRYSDFVVPLVKAVQELSSKNDSLQAVIDTLKSQVNAILQQLPAAKGSVYFSATDPNAPYLKQNAPNPFNNTSIISYSIPSLNSNAQLVICTATGQIVRSIVIDHAGSGEVNINGGELAAGSYFYTLYVDGKMVNSRQMILTK